MEERLCMGCMRTTTQEFICEHCGHRKDQENLNHQLRIGTELDGKYIVGKVLGQGGFGITYLGWDKYMEQPVAIKEFYPASLVNREKGATQIRCSMETMAGNFQASKERFLREAKTMNRFRHIPQIVKLHSFFEANGTAYIVMEYIRGNDLRHYMELRGGRLTLEETLSILDPVMEALAQVHEGGAVHRDISPDNIMLHPTGGAKLLDFGAVRDVHDPDSEQDLAKSTEAILKHGFAPIEQYRSRGSLGPWTDVYAMTATVYYCLTGRLPVDAVSRSVEEAELDLDSIPDLTAQLKQVLAKGLALRAKDRYPDMRALKEALHEKDMPVIVPEENPVISPEPKKKITWVIPAVAATALLIAVLVGALLLTPGKKDAELSAPTGAQPTQVHTVPSTAPVVPTVPVTQPPTQPQESQPIPTEPEDTVPHAATGLISAGGSHTLAIRKDGTVALAGYNGNHQGDVEEWRDIVAVSGTYTYSMGLRGDGTVVATGYDHGQNLNAIGWHDIVAICAKGSHSVGLRSDGTVVSVGGYEENAAVESWTDIIAIAATVDSTMGLKADGSVVCTIPDAVLSGWEDIVYIDSTANTFVGVKSDGTVVVLWDYIWSSTLPQDWNTWTDIVAVSGGERHLVGLKSDGTVVATGDNGSGRCNVSGWSDIVAISAGSDFTVGLRSDGTMVAVGNDKFHQCDMRFMTGIRTPADNSDSFESQTP